MTEPHFHEEQVVGPRHVHDEPPPAAAPVRTRRVVRAAGPAPFGGNPAVAVLAALLAALVVVLVLGYLV